MGESVPNNRECWIPKHSRGVLNAENLSKSDRSSGERYTPATAIPDEVLAEVRRVLNECADHFHVGSHLAADVTSALSLLGDTP